MASQDNATRIRREILIRLAKLHREGHLQSGVDRLPFEMRPKTDTNTRCCIYKDRAVIRSRCMAALGFAVEDEVDDATPLAMYAASAQERTTTDETVMTVLDIACQGCVPTRYLVTNACQGCVARPCKVNCPFDAITYVNGQAQIDKDRCIQCGKCQEVCPYKAILRMPVPCEEACPVGAIHKNPQGKAEINREACISCGRCMRKCPFGAVMERSQMIDVLEAFQKERPVVAMMAPAIAGQFPGDPEQIAEALRIAGFDEVVEVAIGADLTTRKEAAEFLERTEAGAPMMTTSCCPAYMETVQRHIPELAPYVSETRTPMHYTAAWVKEMHPEAITVFVGPCVAKRVEGQRDQCVDYVLTFEEIGAIFIAADIEVAVVEGQPFAKAGSTQGRGFARTGGVSEAVRFAAGADVDLQPICVSGLCKEAIEKLRAYAAGEAPGNLIEVMACEHGCVSGAGVVGAVHETEKEVSKWSKQGLHLTQTETQTI